MGKEVECPECGQVCGSEAGAAKHWYNSHEGECPITRVEKVCEQCGDTFWVRKSVSDSKFCSQSCFGKSQRKGRIQKECKQCGSEFEVYPYREDTAKYCSRECHDEYLSENGRPNGSDNPSWQGGKTEFECEWCGEVFYKYETISSPNRFCSRECHHEWRKNVHVGPLHPLWKGGRQRYGDTWPRQSRRARERDDYTCQLCGDTEDKLGRRLDVHHVQPLRTFENPEKANRLENLIALCRACHQRWEGIPLKPKVVKIG